MSLENPASERPTDASSLERRRHPAGRRLSDRRNYVPLGRTGCKLIDLPRVNDPRGNLTFLEAGQTVPFDISRVYYLYDVPGGESRGGHAHRQLEQVVIAASGSFEVLVDDGQHSERYELRRSYCGLYIPRMVWREIDEFSSGSVCLVIASQHYDENDYYRDYDEFLADAPSSRRDAA
ncbi:MAG: sugar 3,4-ketoisomerase [Solirubrobacteraceae bacterium]